MLGDIDIDGLSLGQDDGRADELGNSDGIELGIRLLDGSSLGDVDIDGFSLGR